MRHTLTALALLIGFSAFSQSKHHVEEWVMPDGSVNLISFVGGCDTCPVVNTMTSKRIIGVAPKSPMRLEDYKSEQYSLRTASLSTIGMIEKYNNEYYLTDSSKRIKISAQLAELLIKAYDPKATHEAKPNPIPVHHK